MRLVGATNHIGVLRQRLVVYRRQAEEHERALRADLASQETRFLDEMASQRAEAQRQACEIMAEFTDKETSFKGEIARMLGEQEIYENTCAQMRSELTASRTALVAQRKQFRDKLQAQEVEIQRQASDAGK